MKKFIAITIAIILAIPQQGYALRPMAGKYRQGEIIDLQQVGFERYIRDALEDCVLILKPTLMSIIIKGRKDFPNLSRRAFTEITVDVITELYNENSEKRLTPGPEATLQNWQDIALFYIDHVFEAPSAFYYPEIVELEFLARTKMTPLIYTGGHRFVIAYNRRENPNSTKHIRMLDEISIIGTADCLNAVGVLGVRFEGAEPREVAVLHKEFPVPVKEYGPEPFVDVRSQEIINTAQQIKKEKDPIVFIFTYNPDSVGPLLLCLFDRLLPFTRQNNIRLVGIKRGPCASIACNMQGFWHKEESETGIVQIFMPWKEILNMVGKKPVILLEPALSAYREEGWQPGTPHDILDVTDDLEGGGTITIESRHTAVSGQGSLIAMKSFTPDREMWFAPLGDDLSVKEINPVIAAAAFASAA